VKGPRRKGVFRITKRALLLTAFCWLMLLSPRWTCAGSCYSLTLPPADRTLGGALFQDAYRNLNEGRLTQALRMLQEALRVDPYLVDFYLLRGYLFSLLGDEEQARKDFRHYLEVRPKDPIAAGLHAALEKRARFVRDTLREGPPTQLVLEKVSPMRADLGFDAAAFRLPIRPSWDRETLAFGDAATGRFWIFRTQGAGWVRVMSGKTEKGLVRVLPGPDGSLLFIFTDGRGMQAVLTGKGMDVLEKWKIPAAGISDAVRISPRMLAVSDRFLRTIRVLDAGSGKTEWEWKLPAPFGEPVSLAAAGSLLAVADRKEREVFLVDVSERILKARVSLTGHPRSLEWVNSGLLLVLTEEGELLALSKEGKEKVRVGSLFPEAWFLFREGTNRWGVTDTRFTRHARFEAFSREGFFALRITGQKGEKAADAPQSQGSCSLEGRLLRPLDDGARPEMILSGVFNGRAVEMEVSERAGRVLLPGASPNWERLESFESMGKAEGLLLKASWIPLKPDILCRIGDFALANGITLHVLAERGPCPQPLLRLAEMTGGRVVFSYEEAQRLGGSGVLELRPKKALGNRVPPLGEQQEGIVVLGREGRRVLEGNIPIWEWDGCFPR